MGASTSPLVGFFMELRRRRVFRTAALYVIGAWLLMQVADVLFPAWGIPEAAIGVLLYAAVLGFPLALVFGWLFDIGSAGIRRTAPANQEELRQAMPLRRVDYLVLALFATAASLIVFNATQRIVTTPAERPVEQIVATPAPAKLVYSLGVLPFANMSPDPDYEYFCDGITEEILNKLASFADLQVIGRTSSFAFKDSDYTIERITELLGVRYLLQGSVRRDGDQLRITSNLVDQSGLQLWSQSYDRELRNVFALQSEIADTVVNRILPHVSSRRSVEEWTPDIEAYQYFLAGREMLRKRLPNYQFDSIVAFDNALIIEPDYADAHAGRALGLALGYNWYTDRSPQEVLDEAQFVAERALDLDADNALGHAALGLVLNFREDFPAAEKLLRRAVALEPSDANAANWLAGTLEAQGKRAESKLVAEQAARRDPLAAIININLANKLAGSGQPDVAEQKLKRLLELPEPSHMVHAALADLYIDTGRLVDAIGMWKRRVLFRIQREGFANTSQLASDYAQLGSWERAEFWQSQLLLLWPQGYQAAWLGSNILVRQGRFADAVVAIEDATSVAGVDLTELGSWTRWYGAQLSLAGRFDEAIRLITSNSDQNRNGFAEVDTLHALAWAYQNLDQPTEAEAVLRAQDVGYRDLQSAGELYLGRHLFLFAQTTLLRGETSLALDRLERAIEAGWLDYYFVLHDPRWNSVRDDRRFVTLMERVKTDLDAQRAEVEAIDAEDGFLEQYEQALALYQSKQERN